MIIDLKTFFLFLILIRKNNGGCDVNDWPHSCLANFRIGKQRCEPCESGRYGCNCSESCPDNTYGPGCYTFCNCPEDEFCDPMVGCINYTHTTQQATEINKSTTANNNVSCTTLQNTASDNKQTTQVTDKNKHFVLNNFVMSLLVSVGTVVFFGVISATILIRISKRFYKREYRKILSHWQSSDLTAVDTNVYASYTYTDSLLTSISSRSNHECAMYDHSSEAASYNILSLRNMSIRGNGGYDVDTCHPITTPPCEKASRDKNSGGRVSDFDLEPECFLNLFDEKQNETTPNQLCNPEVVQYESVLEKEQQCTTKL